MPTGDTKVPESTARVGALVASLLLWVRARAATLGRVSVRGVSTIGLLLSLSALVGGCRGLETLKQRCSSGEVAACESACAKGIAGEQGCFHAADDHRDKAALDVKSADFGLALKYFVKSCDGGYGDGCLFAAPDAPRRPTHLV